MQQSTIKPILKYPGSKNTIAPWIISHFPPHVHYVEPFFGSGAVFFTKQPARHEVINDLSGDVVNLFRVIRERGDDLAALIDMTPWARQEYELSYEPCEDTLERARRFITRSWMAHSSDGLNKPSGWRNHGFHGQSSTVAGWVKVPARLKLAIERLKHVEIECCTALDLIARCDTPSALLYVDPPYVHTTRVNTSFYQFEMTDGDHVLLLNALDKHPGPVVLSGYRCPLYDERLAHWQTVEMQVKTGAGNIRTEVLWLNHAVQPIQSRMFDL